MNILIVGLGTISKKHVEAIRLHRAEAKIYALRSNKNAHLEEGIKNIFGLDEIDFKIDFAIISNSTHLHFEWIEKLIEYKCPLFIEKPALHTLEGTDELLAKMEANNILSYVACNLRFHPCVTFMNSLVKEGSIGKINEVNVYCGSYLPDWRPGQDFRKFYSANADMGGGVHLDLFHELDYTYHLFGRPSNVHSVMRSKSSLKIDAFDYANYLFEYNDFAANLVLNYFRRKVKRTIEVVSEKDTYIADLIQNKVITDTDEILFEAKDFTIMDTYYDQMKYFMDVVEGKAHPMNELKESVEILKICLAHG